MLMLIKPMKTSGSGIENMCAAEYKWLSKAGIDFNTLRKRRIAKYPSLGGAGLASRNGKETEVLAESIFDKTNDLKMASPVRPPA